MLYYLQYEGLPLGHIPVHSRIPIALLPHKMLFKRTPVERAMDDIFIYDASGLRR